MAFVKVSKSRGSVRNNVGIVNRVSVAIHNNSKGSRQFVFTFSLDVLKAAQMEIDGRADVYYDVDANRFRVEQSDCGYKLSGKKNTRCLSVLVSNIDDDGFHGKFVPTTMAEDVTIHHGAIEGRVPKNFYSNPKSQRNIELLRMA